MPAAARGGLAKIALCTAGEIITFIACGRADLFPSPGEREREKEGEGERTIAAHAHLHCKSVGGWFRDSLSFLYSSLPFFFSLLDAPSKAVWRGRVSAGVDGTERVKKKERERLICEVTLLAWPPSKILSVAMKSEASGRAHARAAFNTRRAERPRLLLWGRKRGRR